MDRLKFLLLCLLCGVGTVGFGSRAHAAEPSIRFVGPVGQVQTGSIWPVEVRIDTAGANINAAELQMVVTGEATEITRLGRESSVFTLWPETPSINSATAKFVGGRPGGLVAVDALVGTVFIIARQAGPVTISLRSDSSGLYRHDGAGTKVSLVSSSITVEVADDLVPSLELTSTTHFDESTWGRGGKIDVGWKVRPGEQFSYRLSNDIGTVPDDDLDTEINPLHFDGLEDGIWYFAIKHRLPGEPWSPVFQRRFLLDRTPPAQFSLVQPDPRTVGGRVLLTWTGVDRTAGIREYRGYIDRKNIGTVTSPLRLKKEWRGHTIQIVAIDEAGNQQVSAPWVYGRRLVTIPWWGWMIIGLVALGLSFETGRIFRRR